MSLPRKVRIVDVAPRDGLQNEPKSVPASVKIELIERLQDAGVRAVEATLRVPKQEEIQRAAPGQAGSGGGRYHCLSRHEGLRGRDELRRR